MSLKQMLIGCALVGANVVGCSSMAAPEQKADLGASAATAAGDGPAGAMDEAAMMAAMEKAAKPGAEHADLAKSAGSWNAVVKMFMGPGAPAQESRGTATRRAIMDNRYILEEFKGEMMGTPFEGMLLQGYNNISKEYWAVWIDTWSTWPSLSSGTADANGAMTLRGTMKDVMSPEGRPYHSITTPHGDDKAVMQMFDTLPDGTEWMVMEITYTRA